MISDAGIEQTGHESKAKVFISYSRKDMAFADRLEAALKTRGFEPLIDRTDIYAFEEWWKRIEALIARADTVVFVLSPDAVASDVALREVAYAASLNKRFAPVVCRRIDHVSVPEALAKLNFIFFDDPAQFEQSADKLAEALNTDITWIRQHTDFGEQARRWAQAKGPTGLLLRSPVLEQAERWIASRPPGAPAPTDETQTFIRRSRQGATRRRNILTGSLAAGLVLALGLAGLAYWQRGIAVEQRGIAQQNEAQAKEERDKALTTQSRFLANVSGQLLRGGDAGTAALVAIEALPDNRGIARPYLAEAEFGLSKAQQSLKESSILVGHSSEVYSAVFSPDGRYVATGSDDGTARIWDVETGKTVEILEGHTKPVYSVAFSPNGRYILTGGGDFTMCYWDAQTGKLIGKRSLISENKYANLRVLSVGFSPDGQQVLLSTATETLLIEFRTQKLISKFKGHAIGGSAGAFSPDGQRIVTSVGNMIEIHDSNTGNVLVSFEAEETQRVRSRNVAFSPDGQRVVAVEGSAAHIWDIATGRKIVSLEGHTDDVTMALFSADGQRVLTASADGMARLWDATTGKSLMVLAGQRPNGIPDYSSEKHFLLRTMPLGGTYSAAFSPDGKKIVIASWDRTARIFDLEKHPEVTTLEGRPQYAVFSPDGRHIAINSPEDNQVSIWEVENSKFVATFAVLGASRPDFSPEGRRLLTFDYPTKTARVWDWAANKVLATFTDPSAGKGSFSPDGHQILTFDSGPLRIWNAANGTLLMNLDVGGRILSAKFSKDGQKIITAGHENNLAIIWDAQTGARIRTLAHGERVLSADFSPDGKRIVTSSRDAKAHIWDADSGTELTSFSIVGLGLMSAVFSHDGQWIATAGAGDVGIWDAKTGRATRTFSGAGAILEVEFSPDGCKVLAAIGGTATKIWPMPMLQELIDQSRQSIERCLTQDERRTSSLDPDPPTWCVEMEKWPYQTKDWKEWLRLKRANASPPLPETLEWQSLIAAHH
jgi:WD40 repeat protein